MFPSDRQEQTIIHHLRLRTAPAGPVSRLDPQVARLRAGFALNTADLRPPGLPPAVVLCVRRLRDPQPGGLDLSAAGLPAAPAWQHAMQDALAQLARGAARPAREPVPAGAEAVIFADQGELLACLARDWLEGSLPANWWWQSLLRGQVPERLVVQAWVESPAYFPAALEELAGQGWARQFALRLESSASQRILAAALDHFALPALRAVVLDLGAARSPGEAGSGSTPPAPWDAYAPESRVAGLNAAQAALLGIGLSLRRAPRAARSAVFAARARDWLQALNTRSLLNQSASLPPSPRAAGPGPILPLLPAERRDNPRPDDPQVFPAHPVPYPLSSPGVSEKQSPATLRTDSAGSAPAALGAPPALVSLNHPAAEADLHGLEPALALDEAAAWPPPLDGEWFTTRCGGLFYLVNLGLFLGLYGDFSTPLAPGIGLSIWDFCVLLWSALVPNELPAGEPPDPIWASLARLAGRPEESPPGEGFQPPDEWRIPPDWLEPFTAAGAWRWSAEEGRLRIAHPAGFAVCDYPISAAPTMEALALELPPDAGHDLVHDPTLAFAPAPAAAPDLARWLGWLAPYARARLCLALGLDTPDRLPGLLCACPARVYLTETHLDVTYPLNCLPLEFRIAGLDRNPSWVPAANRYVMFYYEE